MLEWLLTPVDISREHHVDMFTAWHGRLMVLAWGMMVPTGILLARFFKVTPRQNWPHQLDSHVWWYWHLILQQGAVLLMLGALGLIWFGRGLNESWHYHAILGWLITGCAGLQAVSGWLRGSKGGPTDPTTDGSWSGDHYDMTRRRCAFEYFHKIMGYSLFLLTIAGVLTGLWQANAWRWMWVVLVSWWMVLLLVFVVLQRRGYALDTYQAIWGPDKRHPGNCMRPIGWGIRRVKDEGSTEQD